MRVDNIKHQPEQQRFTLALDGTEAVLAYRLQNDNGAKRVDFTHTYVPPAHRGQGVAEALVRHGLRWARDQQYDATASCWYAAKFIR